MVITAQSPSRRSFWIGVVQRSHVQIGVQGGFIQLNHGKKAPLQKLSAGDGLIMYSPRTSYPDGEPLQSFTAIGVVASGEIYQVDILPNSSRTESTSSFSNVRRRRSNR